MKRVILHSAIISIVSASALKAADAPATAPAEVHVHGEEEKHKLGRQKIAGYTVSVILIGETEAGKVVEFDVKLIDATTDPKAMRVWVGAEADTTKIAAKKGATTYHADVKVPSPLPAGAKVWVELETDAGPVKGSFAIQEPHRH